jgi:hypothetical protein
MNLEDVIQRGTRAEQPDATTVAIATLYFVTDEQIIEQSDGSVWNSYSGAISFPEATYLTSIDETTDLINSRQLLAGDNVSLDNTVPGELTIDVDLTPATDPTIITVTDESVSLPNSRQLLANSPISLDIATPKEITIDIDLTSITDKTFATIDDETSGLPNSRKLVAGTNITLNDTVAGELAIIAASGAGASWSLISSVTASGAANDFTNLSAYSELLVFLRQVTADASAIRQLLVSTDNGLTFLNTSGNYVDVDSTGVETNGTVLSFHNTASGNARSAWGILNAFNMSTSYKFWQAGFPTTNLVSYVNTLTALNAIRVRPHTGSFTGGTIYLLGR